MPSSSELPKKGIGSRDLVERVGPESSRANSPGLVTSGKPLAALAGPVMHQLKRLYLPRFDLSRLSLAPERFR
jgi:hypothetical protein